MAQRALLIPVLRNIGQRTLLTLMTSKIGQRALLMSIVSKNGAKDIFKAHGLQNGSITGLIFIVFTRCGRQNFTVVLSEFFAESYFLSLSLNKIITSFTTIKYP